ncbi:MAG: hypothetical protein WCP20_00630 [Desulfuromonadales bacterium]
MIRRAIILCCICLWAIPALAGEADYEKHMARGVTALDSGDIAGAGDEFRAALTEHPNDPEANLYLAIALNRANDPAAESALKLALRQEPGNPRTNLELGTYYFNRKMYEESADYFENLLSLKPDIEMKAAAEGFLNNIRSQSSGKRWGLTVLGGMQYDSNVPLAASGVQLPTGIDRRGDWRGVANLMLTAIPVRTSDTELSLNYSLYQTLHLHLSDFDLTQNLLDVTLKEHFSPLFTARLSAAFESILLGGREYSRGVIINPGLNLTFAPGITTSLDYTFRQSYFENSPLFPTNSEREGTTHTFAINQRLQFFDLLHLRLGYAFDLEDTVVRSWGSKSHRGNAGLGVVLPFSLFVDFSGEASGRRYDDIQADTSGIRTDTTLAGAASVTWQPTSCCGITVGYHYTRNYSTIPSYEYIREITSILLQARF